MTYNRNKIYGIIAGILLAAAAMPAAYAQVFFPPSASLSAGDITTSHILDGTITNVDVSGSAAIDATKVRGGVPAGGILLANGNAMATSSLFGYATSTNRLGVGTSTPTQTLSVHGGALFAGALTGISNITATGTLNITGLTTLGNASTSALSVSGQTLMQDILTLTCTGCISDANVVDTVTLTNITQITNRAISDTTGTLTTGRGGTNTTSYTSSALIASDNAGTSLIASTSPAVSSLDVRGTLRWNGVTYTGPSADGSADQVLSTNGATTLSWGSVGNLYDSILNKTTGTTTVIIPWSSFATVTGNTFQYVPATSSAAFVSYTLSTAYNLMGIDNNDLATYIGDYDLLGSMMFRAQWTATSSMTSYMGWGSTSGGSGKRPSMAIVVQGGIFNCYADNGTASSTTAFTVGFNAALWNTFEIVKNSATSITCRVNGVDAATVSTNVPTGAFDGNNELQFGGTVDSAARTFYLMPGLILKIHGTAL